jgi:hypothetical protein
MAQEILAEERRRTRMSIFSNSLRQIFLRFKNSGGPSKIDTRQEALRLIVFLMDEFVLTPQEIADHFSKTHGITIDL